MEKTYESKRIMEEKARPGRGLVHTDLSFPSIVFLFLFVMRTCFPSLSRSLVKFSFNGWSVREIKKREQNDG